MTASRLFETLKLLIETDSKTKVQPKLENLASALDGLISSSTAATQAAVATALSEVEKAFAEFQDQITPGQWSAIEELGVAHFFDLRIPKALRDSYASNGMAPTVTQTLARKETNDRATMLTNLSATRTGLQKLDVAPKELKPGEADMAVVLPKSVFGSQLGLMAKELLFLNRAFRHIGESATGNPEVMLVKSISSSEPTFELIGSVAAILLVGKIINTYLDAATKAVKLKDLLFKSKDAGARQEIVDGFSKQVKETIQEAVTSAVEQIKPVTKDKARAAELGNALRIDIARLFELFDHGVTIEIRAAEPEKAEEGDNQEAVLTTKEIKKLGKILQFPKSEVSVLELSSPPKDDDNGVQHTEKPPKVKKPKADGD